MAFIKWAVKHPGVATINTRVSSVDNSFTLALLENSYPSSDIVYLPNRLHLPLVTVKGTSKKKAL